MSNLIVLSILVAFCLDLAFGDPRWFPHPIRAMGWLIKKIEHPIQRLFHSKKISGIAFCLFIVGISYSVVLIVLGIAIHLSNWLAFLVSVFFIYASISIKDLKDHSMLVYHSLNNYNIIEARENLSMIVGRDTGHLDEESIIRATIESIAENTVDGIISPIFYACLGGAPLAIAYKAVNTLDSMIGYKDEKYREFGWFSARLDDMVNFIPSRLSVFFISFASSVLKKNFNDSWKISLSNGNRSLSPNSGYPQAAFAGALGIELSGNAFYKGILVVKPTIGKNKNILSIGHIKEAIKISYTCSMVMVILVLVLSMLLIII